MDFIFENLFSLHFEGENQNFPAKTYPRGKWISNFKSMSNKIFKLN